VESGRQIRGDHSVPLLDREILQLRHELDARIINKDIDCPEGLFGVAGHVGDLDRLGHIGARIRRRYSEHLLDAAPLLLNGIRVTETVEGHVCALGGEGTRDGKTYTGRGTRYDDGFSADHQTLAFLHISLPEPSIPLTVDKRPADVASMSSTPPASSPSATTADCTTSAFPPPRRHQRHRAHRRPRHPRPRPRHRNTAQSELGAEPMAVRQPGRWQVLTSGRIDDVVAPGGGFR
jgi:hypothetical protein